MGVTPIHITITIKVSFAIAETGRTIEGIHGYPSRATGDEGMDFSITPGDALCGCTPYHNIDVLISAFRGRIAKTGTGNV